MKQSKHGTAKLVRDYLIIFVDRCRFTVSDHLDVLCIL